MNGATLAARWAGWGPRLLSVLRIAAAFMFVQAGAMKLFAFPAGMPPDGGTATFMTQVWFGSPGAIVSSYLTSQGTGQPVEIT